MDDENKTFQYDDPRLLNDLVMHLSEGNCKFSAFLRPDIEEFIEFSKKFRSSMATFEVSDEIREELRELKINYFQWQTILMYKLCRENNIIPFKGLKFNGGWGLQAEIEYYGNSLDDLGETLYRKCNSPRALALGNQWYLIDFEDVEDVKVGKETIEAFIEQGYRVTKINADLNPRSGTSDHYYGWYKCDATLWAYNGEITVRGKFPDDFDPTKIQRKKLPKKSEKKALLGAQKLLKELPTEK